MNAKAQKILRSIIFNMIKFIHIEKRRKFKLLIKACMTLDEVIGFYQESEEQKRVPGNKKEYNFYTIYREYQELSDGEVSIYLTYGCNGKCHTETLEILLFDRNGEADDAEVFYRKTSEPCDGSCGDKEDKKGFFHYPF